MKKLLIISFALAFFAFAPSAMAATCLWTAASSTAPTAWNNADNWSCAAIPTSADDVVFDDAAAGYTVNITAFTFNSLSTTGTTYAVTFTGSVNVNVYGDITLKATDIWTKTNVLTFRSNLATLTSAGVDMSSSGASIRTGATLSLGDNLTIGSIVLYSDGTTAFVTNNHAVNTGSFVGFGSTGSTLTLGTSSITCTSFSFPLPGLTVTSTDHTIIINSNSATAIEFGGYAWGKVNFKSNASAARAHAITFGTGASFVEFNIDQLTDRRDVSISFSGDFSVASSSTWKSGGIGNDNPTYRLLIKSSAIGTARTMTVTAASQTITLQDVDLQDIKIADTNTPTVSLTRIGDAGGNATTTGGGYIQDVSTPKTVYDVSGTSNPSWYDNVWATSSGGSVNLNNYPLPQDTAVFDSNSVTGTDHVIYMRSPRVGIIDASAITNQIYFNLPYGNSTYYGSITIPRWGCSATTATFDARVNNIVLSITDNFIGSNAPGFTIDSYGNTVSLGASLNIKTGTFTLTQGTLDLNGQTLTTRIFSSSNANTRELKDSAGGGKIVINALTGTGLTFATDTGLTVSNAPDIDIGDSNNTLTASTTIAFGSAAKTFGDFKITKHAGDFDVILTGTGHTFGIFTLETPDATYQYSDVAFTAGETYTVSSFVADGTASYLINISSVTAAAHTLSDSGGTNTVTYCNIYNSNAGGGATWNSLTSAGNTDQGGNTGWIFTAAPPAVGGYDDTTINVYDE